MSEDDILERGLMDDADSYARRTMVLPFLPEGSFKISEFGVLGLSEDKGLPEVKRIQRLINARQSHAALLKIDGFFGALTRQALKQCQEIEKIPQTGITDKLTWFALLKGDHSRRLNPHKSLDLVFAKSPVWSLTLKQKFEKALNLMIAHLPVGVDRSVNGAISRDSIAQIANELVLWTGSKVIWNDRRVSIVPLETGAVYLDRDDAPEAEEFTAFLGKTASAETTEQLNEASIHVARVITLLGVDVFREVVNDVGVNLAKEDGEEVEVKSGPSARKTDGLGEVENDGGDGYDAGVEDVVPNSNTGKYTNLREMDSKYIGEETGAVWGTKVKYLDDTERLQYKLQIKDGKLYDNTGNLFDTAKAQSAFGGKGNAIFVMDEAGSIFASTVHSPGKFHHSSFLSGKPVASAGEIVVNNGVLQNVTRRSGHYRPTADQLDQLLQELSSNSINLSKKNVGAGF